MPIVYFCSMDREEKISQECMEKVRFTLRKDEKLRHRTLVNKLFDQGESVYEYPIRAAWMVIDDATLKSSFKVEVPANTGRLQMLITIPKRKQHRAVDRVLLRRRIREAYRLSRLPLKHKIEGSEEGKTLCVAFIYLSDKINDFESIRRKMEKILVKLAEKV